MEAKIKLYDKNDNLLCEDEVKMDNICEMLLHEKEYYTDELERVENELLDLQISVNKAIEYIKKEQAKDEDSFIDLYLDKYEEDLLNILKGEE